LPMLSWLWLGRKIKKAVVMIKPFPDFLLNISSNKKIYQICIFSSDSYLNLHVSLIFYFH
jgi:hypothetical protein